MKRNNLNLIAAVAFVMAFLFFWDKFVVSRYVKPSSEMDAPVTTPVDKNAPAMVSPRSAADPQAASPGESKQITLETDEERVTFETRGARVVSWQYKEGDHWVELVPAEKERVSAPLETFPDLVFSVKQSGRKATFTGLTADGIRLTKSIELADTSPFHTLTLTYENTGSVSRTLLSELGWGPGLSKTVINGEDTEKAVQAEMRAIAYSERLKSWKPGFIFHREIDRVETGAFEWVGVDNHHFLAAILAPPSEAIGRLHVQVDRKSMPLIAVSQEISLEAGASAQKSFELYVGPKQYAHLGDINRHLQASVDFGFFGPIAKGLLVGLTFFRDLTGGYGWAIILVTLCIQVVVFPLTKRSFAHSVRMKDLQPKIKQIQEQYKSDPKRMQVEMLNFYRKNGMKFMGMEGCFPVVLQIPVFIAFYATLNSAYELRGASFLWIPNLAVYDPTYVLPILMGLGMFLQQKLTAVAMDPAQAKMMLFMPIIFTVMFIKLPAGLVLYWVVNSIATIVIQKFISWRKHHTPTPA